MEREREREREREGEREKEREGDLTNPEEDKILITAPTIADPVAWPDAFLKAQ